MDSLFLRFFWPGLIERCEFLGLSLIIKILMKKFVMVFFALVLSISSSFAYRIFYAIQVENDVIMWCDNDGGTCLPTVIVE